MGRKPCCEKEVVNRGSWSAPEDKILENYIKTHGEGKWRDLPKRAGLNRCGKSCRLRWLNYLRPDIKRGNISKDEEELIIKLHKLLGNRWSLIAGRLPGRTDNEIKNYWNTYLSKSTEQRKQQNQSQNSFPDPTDINPKKSGIKPSAQTLKSSPESSPPVIRTKASKCTKVIVLMQAAAIDSCNKLVNSYEDDDSVFPASDIENKMMSLVREGPESQSFSTQKDDNNENLCDFLIDFDIGELLVPALPAGRSCSSDEKTSELVEQSRNIVIEGDQNGQSSDNYACVDLAAHFGDEADNNRLDDLIAEAMPENWVASGLLQQNEAEVDLSHFLNSE